MKKDHFPGSKSARVRENRAPGGRELMMVTLSDISEHRPSSQ